MLKPLILTVFLSHTFLQQTVTGSKEPDEEMLYMASVQNPIRHVCWGFLVSDQFVLTLADYEADQPRKVILGNRKKKIKLKIRGQFKNDELLLLKLEKKVLMGQDQILRLPTTNMEVKAPRCLLPGRGVNDNLIANPVLIGGKCNNIPVICGDYTKRTVAAGDFGVPLVCDMTAVGILKSSKGIDRAVFVNISKHITWINKTIQ